MSGAIWRLGEGVVAEDVENAENAQDAEDDKKLLLASKRDHGGVGRGLGGSVGR